MSLSKNAALAASFLVVVVGCFFLGFGLDTSERRVLFAVSLSIDPDFDLAEKKIKSSEHSITTVYNSALENLPAAILARASAGLSEAEQQAMRRDLSVRLHRDDTGAQIIHVGSKGDVQQFTKEDLRTHLSHLSEQREFRSVFVNEIKQRDVSNSSFSRWHLGLLAGAGGGFVFALAVLLIGGSRAVSRSNRRDIDPQ